jgi:hypothetical protein
LLAQRYRNIPNSFIDFDISLYLHEEDITRFTLLHQNTFHFHISFLVDQLNLYPKAAVKLPSFTKVYAHFTPRAYEQSSAEKIALFKSSLFSGKLLLDLSGGLGVDDWAFARTFDQVDSIDIDDQLNKLVRKNFEKLGVANINRMDADAYDFVRANNTRYDCIYIDADRRIQESRSYALSETEPNILALKDDLFRKTERVLLKVSPMLDLEAVAKELGVVNQFWVISLKNEVKEVLVELRPQPASSILVTAVDIDDSGEHVYSGYRHRELTNNFAQEGPYFYEPALALIKSGLAPQYLQELHILQMAPNSIYGLSDFWVQDFFGRRFQVVFQGVFSKSKLSAYLKTNNLFKANIAKRNFKMEVAAIRKQFGLKDGGEDYLFFTENAVQEKLFFHCRKKV